MSQGLATSLAIAILCLATPGTASAIAVCDCPADLNSDGSINTLDLGVLLSSWTLPPATACSGAACVADLDHNGVVNSLDLGVLLSSWGECVFNYGPQFADAEARQIGLEMLGPGGPLLLPQNLYNRIDRDLDLIRAHTPALATETHTLAWSPQSLIVALVAGAKTDGFEALNECLGVTGVTPIGFSFQLVHFPAPINVEALAEIYASLAEVQFAEPDGLIGGQNFWVPTQLPGTPDDAWQWNIDDGYWDCFDGCDCHNQYVFRTNAAGAVQLISHQFVGAPWCPASK